jgi:hypothetical protein
MVSPARVLGFSHQNWTFFGFEDTHLSQDLQTPQLLLLKSITVTNAGKQL